MTSQALKVLIVDDEAVVRQSLAAFFEDEGFEVAMAADGEEALRLVADRRFDFGVIDMRLPGIDGNAVILESHEIQPDMRFLIHTGSASYQLPPNLKELGIAASDVFRKPIKDMTALAVAAQRILDRRIASKAAVGEDRESAD